MYRFTGSQCFAVLSVVVALSLPAKQASAQCVAGSGAQFSLDSPVDLNFGSRDLARVVTTGNFDGISGNETGITPDNFPIIRVDIGQAGSVTVKGGRNFHTYNLPASGSYAVVFPHAVNFNGSGNAGVTFSVTASDGPRSGGTAQWSTNSAAAPLKTLTSVGFPFSPPAFCNTVPEAVELPQIAQAAHRLALAEVGTFRSREANATYENGRYVYGRVFAADQLGDANHAGLIAGAGIVTQTGRISAFLSSSRASVASDDLSADIEALGFGLTGTVLMPQAYLDLVAKVSRLEIDMGDISADGTSDALMTTVSAEVGATALSFGQNTLTPEAQIVVSSLQIDDIDLTGGSTAVFAEDASVHGRVGLGFERPAAAGEVFARADLWHTFENGSAVSIDSGTSTAIEPLETETWVDLSAGLSQALGDNGQFRGAVTSRVGEDAVGWGGELTLSFAF